MLHNLSPAGVLSALILSSVAVSAPAAAVSLVVDGVDGTFTSLQPRSPGVYGVELRGGRAGAADWEIGVGNQTSVSGKFNQGEFNWAASSDPYAFNLSWTASGLSITIGGVTVTDAGTADGFTLTVQHSDSTAASSAASTARRSSPKGPPPPGGISSRGTRRSVVAGARPGGSTVAPGCCTVSGMPRASGWTYSSVSAGCAPTTT